MPANRICWIALAAILVTGCVTQPQQASSTTIAPGDAVQLAAASPRNGVTGVFALTVRATGRTHRVHLNSELDYRDPRNLSVAVMPKAARQLETRLGAAPETAMLDKRILVTGTARKVRIDFLLDNKPTGKYYYQTHVLVTDASQIQIL